MVKSLEFGNSQSLIQVLANHLLCDLDQASEPYTVKQRWSKPCHFTPFRWVSLRYIHLKSFSPCLKHNCSKNIICPQYCSSSARDENWNNNILTHTVTVSHFGKLRNCQGWFRDSSTQLQSKTIIPEAELQRPALLSSQFYLVDSLNTMTYKKRQCFDGMQNTEVNLELLASHTFFVWESHSIFQDGKAGSPKEAVSQLEEQHEKGKGGHLGRSIKLQSKIQTSSIRVHTLGHPLLIECVQWQGVPHLPLSNYSILIRHFMHLFKEYWLRT